MSAQALLAGFSEQILLEQACRLAVPTLQVQFYLLEKTATIEDAIYRGGEFIQQSIHGCSARGVAAKGCKVGIDYLLGLVEDAGTKRAREADEAANRFVQVVHIGRSMARPYTVPMVC